MYFHIAQSFGLSESNAYCCIKRAEELLIRSSEFSLPGRKALQAADSSFEIVIIDATETKIERPPKKASLLFRKKETPPPKTQVVVDQKNGKIICTAFGKGHHHDFSVFKKRKMRLLARVAILADSAYQGNQNLHPNSWTPNKATKLKPLTKAQKIENGELSSILTKVENALAFIKRFKVFSTRYRNRAKRFGLRFNLFAAICNCEINLN